MLIDTRYFGEIDMDEKKIVHFEHGLFGFEEYKDYTILYDSESEKEPFFSWLQCTTEKSLAFPVVNPLKVKSDYDPVVEDELMKSLGEFGEDDLVVLVLATIPPEVQKTSVTLKAPLIINAGTRKGVQLVADNQDYEIKHYLMAQH